MDLPYKELIESHSQKPEGLTNSTNNMLKMIGSAYKTCVCKICEYIKGQTMSTSAIHCECKPCNCKECTGSGNYVETANIELRLRYENKFRNELDRVKIKNKGMPYGNVNTWQERSRSCNYMQDQREECKQKAFNRSIVTVAPVEESGRPLENCWCDPCSCNHCTHRGLNVSCNQTHEMSTGIDRRTNCQCENCINNSCQNTANNTDACKCLMRRGLFRKPTEKFIKDYDIHSATIVNQPLIIKGKHPDRYDPALFHGPFPCTSSTCECRNKNAQITLYNITRLHKEKFTNPETCKCTECICLACSFSNQRLGTDSLESLRTCVMCSHTGNKFKVRSKFDERGRADQVSKKGSIRVVEGPNNVIVRTDRNSGNTINHGIRTCYGTPSRSCSCTKQNNSHKPYFKEMLDNVYSDFEIEDHEKNFNKCSTADINKIPNGKLIHSNYEVCTQVNTETNTENNMANKFTETDYYLTDKKKNAGGKVKNYEYVLKIEIQTPNLNQANEATKQRIKMDSKKGVKEQTRRVIGELFSDISKNSLFNENLSEINTTTDEQKLKNMASSEQSTVRSILKPSKMKEARSSTIQRLSSTKKSRGTLEDCFILRCHPSLQHTMRQTTDDVMIENVCTQIFPTVSTAKLTNSTSANSMENVSIKDIETIAVRDLDELRVQDTCLRRVSDHTVSLKWNQPKAMEDVMGYEILINGKTVEKILTPTRCVAVFSCLPPVGRILITIRTITKTKGLPEVFPCSTIGYRPRANKTICV